MKNNIKLFIPRWNLNVLHIIYLEENYRIVCDTLIQHRTYMIFHELKTKMYP